VFGQIACCLQDVPFEFHRFRLPRRCRQGKSESAPFPSPSHNISSAASDPCGAIWGSVLAACGLPRSPGAQMLTAQGSRSGCIHQQGRGFDGQG
jgi:hypothetical protein